MNRYAARRGNVATLTLDSKYQLPQTTVQAQTSAPSVLDTQFRSYTEDPVKEPIDVIVDEHNHHESTSVASVPLVIPIRSESLPSVATSSPPTTYPSPQSAITQ